MRKDYLITAHKISDHRSQRTHHTAFKFARGILYQAWYFYFLVPSLVEDLPHKFEVGVFWGHFIVNRLSVL